jgi:hypothetical protein
MQSVSTGKRVDVNGIIGKDSPRKTPKNAKAGAKKQDGNRRSPRITLINANKKMKRTKGVGNAGACRLLEQKGAEKAEGLVA